ncbi:unnamed protein product, partial [Rotaria magnacalcarata]
SNQTVKEWQTKLKAYEQDIEQLSEDKDNLERQFRQIQTERDELQEEISNIGRD